MSPTSRKPPQKTTPLVAPERPPLISVWNLRAIGAIQRHATFSASAQSLHRDYGVAVTTGVSILEQTVTDEWLTAPQFRITSKTVKAVDNISELRGPRFSFEGAPTQSLENRITATELALLTSLDQPTAIRNSWWRTEVANVGNWINRWKGLGLVQSSNVEPKLSKSPLSALDTVVISDAKREPVEALLVDIYQQLEDILPLPEFNASTPAIGHGSSLPI